MYYARTSSLSYKFHRNRCYAEDKTFSLSMRNNFYSLYSKSKNHDDFISSYIQLYKDINMRNDSVHILHWAIEQKNTRLIFELICQHEELGLDLNAKTPASILLPSDTALDLLEDADGFEVKDKKTLITLLKDMGGIKGNQKIGLY